MSEGPVPDNHINASTLAADNAAGILEDTNFVIYGPFGPAASVGPPTVPPERRDLDGVLWWYVRPLYLIWTPTMARALLSGALVSDLLGTEYILLDGVHRPSWHPTPGIDLPHIAFFPDPPGDFTAVDLMVRLIASIRH